MVDMNALYAQNPGTAPVQPAEMMPAAQATAGKATATTITQPRDPAASTTGSAATQAFNGASAGTTGYDPALGTVQSNETAAGQLLDITKQDSPLMQRARAEANDYSASRGLRNSTIAAGATEAALVDRALPVAQQDAAANRAQALENQSVMNRAREFSAAAENTAQLQDAALQTQTSQFNANLGTQVSLANAQAQNQRLAQNAEFQQRANELTAGDVNKMRELVLTQNADFNKQYLTGTQAMDLASLQGKYQLLLSQNETAARFYDSYFTSISNIMSNDQLPPDRVARYVTTQQNMLEAGLRLLDVLNGTSTSSTMNSPASPNPAPNQLPNLPKSPYGDYSIYA